MKLLLQKVSRALVEVDGMVECRIGTGLVISLAVRAGNTAEEAQKLAAKVVKLNLWPEMADLESPFKSNVVDNGYEILVVLQQSLCSVFPKLEPRAHGAMDLEEAKGIVEAFVKRLKQEYQEEMVVGASFSPEMRVEIVGENPSMFELDSDNLGATRAPVTKAAVMQRQAEPALVELEPDVALVTKALRMIPLQNKTKATLESCRVFRVFSMKKFRAALSEAGQSDSDAFAEALEGAAKHFSAKQLDQIMSWTGLTIVAPPRDDVEVDEEDEAADAAEDLGSGNLDEQLAELQEELNNPEAARKRKLTAVKQEEEGADLVARARPDWKGRAAPETPAAVAARAWAANRAGRQQQWNQKGWPGGKGGGKKGGKGWGRGGPRPWRSYGIASLDESARLHGNSTAGFEYGQLAWHSDKESKFAAKEEAPEDDEGGGDEAPPAKKKVTAPRLPKGTPTLAPMTPAPAAEKDAL